MTGVNYTLSVPDESYSRYSKSALNWITVYLYLSRENCLKTKSDLLYWYITCMYDNKDYIHDTNCKRMCEL